MEALASEPTALSGVVASDQVELVSPAQLRPHPLLAHIPEKADDHPDYLALVDSVRAEGFLTPALIDVQDRVLCGRHRRRAAKALGVPLPCRRVAPDRAAEVILAELCIARHLPKGALAFLAVPLLGPALHATRERQIACLKKGTHLSPVVQSLDDGDRNALSKAGIAARLGFGRSTLNYAEKLHELLPKVEEKCGVAVRRHIEERVLSGDLDIGGACTAAANHIKGNVSGGDTSKRQEHDRLFTEAFSRAVLHWEKASPTQREQIAQELRTLSHQAPEALKAELRRIFR